jgi:hypothetical protein
MTSFVFVFAVGEPAKQSIGGLSSAHQKRFLSPGTGGFLCREGRRKSGRKE